MNIFFQDGLAETWQTEMFSCAVDLKTQSSPIEKCQPDFMRWLQPAVRSKAWSTYSCPLFFGYFTSISSPSSGVLWIASSQMKIKPLPSGLTTAPRTALGSSRTDTDGTTHCLPIAYHHMHFCLLICFTHSDPIVQMVLPTPKLNHRTQSKTSLR